MLKRISQSLTIPVTALGGAGDYDDIEVCYKATLVNGLASGSVFVYQDQKRGVLINYPEKKSIKF